MREREEYTREARGRERGEREEKEEREEREERDCEIGESGRRGENRPPRLWAADHGERRAVISPRLPQMHVQ